ncbi:MAG: hypothetical protein ACT4P4_11050 [Betaproteobacteria bacterium]
MTLLPARYQELSDSGPPALRAFVNGAVLRKGLCPAGYTADEPVTHWGHVEIVGRCNPAG